jgi:hypothetical protein
MRGCFEVRLQRRETSPPGPLSHLPPAPRRERGNPHPSCFQGFGRWRPLSRGMGDWEMGEGVGG